MQCNTPFLADRLVDTAMQQVRAHDMHCDTPLSPTVARMINSSVDHRMSYSTSYMDYVLAIWQSSSPKISDHEVGDSQKVTQFSGPDEQHSLRLWRELSLSRLWPGS